MLGYGSPLLNLVFQFVVFITLVAICSREIKDDVDLPLSSTARHPDSSRPDVLYVNIDYKGRIDTPGGFCFGAAEIQSYLDWEYWVCAKPRTVVIIRADRDCDFDSVLTVLGAAEHAGFKAMQLRVYSVATSYDYAGVSFTVENVRPVGK